MAVDLSRESAVSVTQEWRCQYACRALLAKYCIGSGVVKIKCWRCGQMNVLIVP